MWIAFISSHSHTNVAVCVGVPARETCLGCPRLGDLSWVSTPGRPVSSHIDYFMDRCQLTSSGSSGHLIVSKRLCIMYAVRFGLSFSKSCNFEAPFESIYMYVTLII